LPTTHHAPVEYPNHRQPSCSWHSLTYTSAPSLQPNALRRFPRLQLGLDLIGKARPRPSVALGTHSQNLTSLPPPALPPPPPTPLSLFARAFSASSQDSFPLIAIEHSPICTAFANSNRRRSHSSGNQLSPDLDTFSTLASSRAASSGPAPTFRFELCPRTPLIARHHTIS
jgi:hypothetical protein